MSNLRKGKRKAPLITPWKNSSVFTPTVDEELTMIGPSCLLPKNTKNSLTEEELKTTLHALIQLATSMYAALTLVKIYKNELCRHSTRQTK